ncbi:hypothetical protein L9F63_017114, partial [Diploptera punctata]
YLNCVRLAFRYMMEEVPLRLSSDERDFEVDESDFLLQPPDHEIRTSAFRYRNSRKCSKCFLCSNV